MNQMNVWGMTDIGLVRKENQDAYVTAQHTASGRTVGVVCDGMGGPAGGRVASQIAVSVYLEELEKLSSLGKSYLGALRREVRRLMLVADETLDGAVAESVTEKLGERELLELKKAFGARAAKKLGTNVQIGNPREVREENERDFCV